jgi:hypothetical protein
MKWSVAITLGVALAVGAIGSRTARAQMPPQCNAFMSLRDDAQQKGAAIGMAEKRHADRKDVCALVTRFAVAEGKAVKFLEANQTWCGVPAESVKQAKAAHEKTLKFRTAVCAPAPQPHIPTLSDALGTPELDTAKNTRTGKGGTFDTLTGNPLSR